MNRKILVSTTALLTVMNAGSVFAQDYRSDGSGDTSIFEPTHSAATELGFNGDNLGNHVASKELDMDGFPIIGLADPEEQEDAVNLKYLEKYVSDNKDNLGDHTATMNLNMGPWMVRVQAPQGPNDATNKAYVDTEILNAGDNLGNHTATTNINVNGHRVVNVDAPVNNRDAVNYTFLRDYVTNNGDDLGNHMAEMDLSLMGFGIVNLKDPVSGKDGANKDYVDDAVEGAIDDAVTTLRGIRIDTGTGLTGGGDLSANRTISFDTSWGDNRYALRTLSMTAGDGMTGGGNLSASRTFSVDSSVVRTSRSLAAGTGLTGGGDFSANRTISFDTAWGDARYVDHTSAETISGAKTFTGVVNVINPTANSHATNKSYVDAAIIAGNTTYTAGDGLTLTGTVFSVDNTVLRNFGAQNISGVKTFLNTIAGSITGNAQTATVLQTSRLINGKSFNGSANINLDYLVSLGTLAAETGRAVHASGVYTYNVNGQSLGGTTPSTHWSVLGFGRGAGSVQIGGNWTSGGQELYFRSLRDVTDDWWEWKEIVHSGNVATYIAANETTYSAGTGLSLAGTQFSFNQTWGDARYALATRSITAGTGLTGGGNLTANRTLAVDSAAVMMLSGNQTVAGTKTFSAPVNLATPTAAAHGTTKAYVDAAIVAGNTTYTAGTGLSLSGTVFSFNQTWGDARYALATRSITAGTGLTGGGNLTANRALAVDSASVMMLSGNQNVNGSKSFGSPVSVQTPTAGNHATTKDYVDNAIVAGNTTYTAGTGLTLTGTQFTFNQTWGDARYALNTRNVIAGVGLTGGGNLTADRTLTVDTSQVMMLSGAQTVNGSKTFSAAITTQTPSAANHAATKAYVDSAIAGAYTAGTGLSLSGTQFSFNTAWGDARYVTTARQILTGTGLTGGGDFSANRVFAVDSAAVMMLTGNQTVAGIKTFSSPVVVATPTATNHATTKAYVDAISARTITAGTGLTGGGNLTANRTLAVDSTAVMMLTGTQTVAGIKTFSGTLNVATPTAAANAVNKGYVDGLNSTLSGRQIIAGTGLLGGGNLTADRTLSVDTATVMMLGTAQTVTGVKTFTNPIVGALKVDDARADVLNTSASPTFIDTPANTPTSSLSNVFSQGFSGNGWRSGVVVKGWSANYATWALSGPADTTTDNRWFLRSGVGATWGTDYEVVHSGNVADYVAANSSYTAGTGLTLTGTQFTFNQTWGDARYALAARSITAGTGLTGGGNLTANRALAVDSAAVMMLSGNQTVAGTKTFSSPVVVATPTATTHATTKAYVDAISARTITAGTGLTGGGNLTANRTLAVDSATVMMLAGAQTVAGAKTFSTTIDASSVNQIRLRNGVSGAGTLLRNDGATFYILMTDSGSAQAGSYNGLRPLSINTTTGVVSMANGATINSATINGATISNINANNTLISNVANPTAAQHAATKSYVDAQIAANSGSTYTAGTGLTLTGTQFTFNQTWGDARYALAARTITPGAGLNGGGNLTANRSIALDANQIRRAAGDATAGVMSYAGTARTAGNFYGGTTNPTSTTRLNYDGALYATNFWATNYYYFSDRNLKKDITPISGKAGLEIVRNLESVSFAWIANDEKALGLIAQQVEEVVPTAVRTNDAGTKAVDYVQLIAPMLSAIQELDARVTALEEIAR